MKNQQVGKLLSYYSIDCPTTNKIKKNSPVCKLFKVLWILYFFCFISLIKEKGQLVNKIKVLLVMKGGKVMQLMWNIQAIGYIGF